MTATLTDCVRILLVDDHPLVRDGLKLRLAARPEWEVCGEVASADEALRAVAELEPDIVVLDLSLKQGSGLNVIGQLAAHPNPPKVLVCSMHDEHLYAQRAIHAGAMGYLHKQQAADKLIPAIERILEGKIYLSDAVSESVLTRMSNPSRRTSLNPIERLTDRELAVFEALGRGMTMQQIANALHLSVKTVETYRERAKGKLDVRTAAELLRYAVKWVGEHASE